jgi:CRISPR-associated exonuclease Cas4
MGVYWNVMGATLVAAAVLAVALVAYVLLEVWRRRERAALGLGAGTLVWADDSRRGSPTLYSRRHGLQGRCDHLIRDGPAYIPMEQKPSATRLQPGHRLQLAAQCLLVQERYGVRPPYGVVVLAGGRRERVPFTPELERELLDTMAAMRHLLTLGAAPGPRWAGPKCPGCGYRAVCWSE